MSKLSWWGGCIPVIDVLMLRFDEEDRKCLSGSLLYPKKPELQNRKRNRKYLPI